MLPSICPSEGRRMRCWHGNLHISEAAPVDDMVRGWRHPRMVGRCVDLAGDGGAVSGWLCCVCCMYPLVLLPGRALAGWPGCAECGVTALRNCADSSSAVQSSTEPRRAHTATTTQHQHDCVTTSLASQRSRTQPRSQHGDKVS